MPGITYTYVLAMPGGTQVESEPLAVPAALLHSTMYVAQQATSNYGALATALAQLYTSAAEAASRAAGAAEMARQLLATLPRKEAAAFLHEVLLQLVASPDLLEPYMASRQLPPLPADVPRWCPEQRPPLLPPAAAAAAAAPTPPAGAGVQEGTPPPPPLPPDSQAAAAAAPPPGPPPGLPPALASQQQQPAAAALLPPGPRPPGWKPPPPPGPPPAGPVAAFIPPAAPGGPAWLPYSPGTGPGLSSQPTADPYQRSSLYTPVAPSLAAAVTTTVDNMPGLKRPWAGGPGSTGAPDTATLTAGSSMQEGKRARAEGEPGQPGQAQAQAQAQAGQVAALAGPGSNLAAIQQAREARQLMEVPIGQELLSRVRSARSMEQALYTGRWGGGGWRRGESCHSACDL